MICTRGQHLFPVLCVVALCAAPVVGQTNGVPPMAAWEAVSNYKAAALDGPRWQKLVQLMQRQGFPLDVAEHCLVSIQDAVRQGLPCEPLVSRMEEGVAKHVDTGVLKAAVQQRLQNLSQAQSVLQKAGYPRQDPRQDSLLRALALALESGLSADAASPALEREQGKSRERMQSIIEAGETLRLAGMDDPLVGQLMTDFVERNLRRVEILRASRFAIQQHTSRVDPHQIRERLWDGTGTRGRWGREGRSEADRSEAGENGSFRGMPDATYRPGNGIQGQNQNHGE